MQQVKLAALWLWMRALLTSGQLPIRCFCFAVVPTLHVHHQPHAVPAHVFLHSLLVSTPARWSRHLAVVQQAAVSGCRWFDGCFSLLARYPVDSVLSEARGHRMSLSR
ncbi:hypothetical protein COO60DRAFT_611310 [Scenedesmus sp. NREL 46B-D3]|nr:hypothetical protein COO60DRAFT_611310 [Scenedesmus sp. NREL 46B-D3]